MVWYFTGVNIMKRTIHDLLEIWNFSFRVETYFTPLHNILNTWREISYFLAARYYTEVTCFYSHWEPSRASAPCALGTRAFKFQRICGSAGEYICEFSINWPVFSATMLCFKHKEQCFIRAGIFSQWQKTCCKCFGTFKS